VGVFGFTPEEVVNINMGDSVLEFFVLRGDEGRTEYGKKIKYEKEQFENLRLSQLVSKAGDEVIVVEVTIRKKDTNIMWAEDSSDSSS
jgi:hypothetical protein